MQCEGWRDESPAYCHFGLLLAPDLDGLAGTDQRVPYDDIVQLEVRKVHSGKTTGLVLGIVGGVAAALFVILLVVVASEGGFGFPEN